jgi:uncharacterized protein YqeY
MLEEKIMEDYKQAMKAKDAVKASTLSFLRSQLNYSMIEKRVDKLNDTDVIIVIKKQIKQRQDSIEQFEKGGRKDLVDKERKELTILKGYLPEEMSEDIIKTLIEGAIKESEAVGMKDMGKVMKVLLPRVAGKADNALVSNLVKERLSKM